MTKTNNQLYTPRSYHGNAAASVDEFDTRSLTPIDDSDDDSNDAHDRDEFERIFSTCPACSGEGDSMGTLGWYEWFRCRACGTTFNEHGDVS